MKVEKVFPTSPRPPLSKKLFPVSGVVKRKANREVGNLLFFFPNFIFYKIEYTGGGR